MHILHIGKYYPPEWGGIETVTEALAVDHAKAGHDVTVLCFSRNETSDEQAGLLRIKRYNSAVEISSQPLSLRYAWQAVLLSRKSDIIHLHTPNLLASLASLFAPRRAKIVIQWHADIENKGIIGKMVRPLERAMLKRANLVATTTSVYAQASSVLQGTTAPIISIPLGIEDIELPEPDNELAPYILFVGRLVPYKGLEGLIRAMSTVQDGTQLRIVGQGPLEAELKRQVRNLRLEKRIIFEGRTALYQLHRLYAGAQLFCLPSENRLEAFGVVLIEAMRAGLPLVTTNIPGSGVSWVNKNGISGYHVPVGNVEALSCAISKILQDPVLRKKLSSNSRLRYETYLSRRQMSAAFMQAYNTMLD